MKNLILFPILLVFLHRNISAERHQPHLHPEVKIVGYTGPLTADILRLFRGAEDIEFIDCNLTSAPDKIYIELPRLRRLYFENTTSSAVHDDVADGGDILEEFHYINCKWDNPNLKLWNHHHSLKKLVIADHEIPFVELEANSLDKTVLEHLEIRKSGVEKIDDLAFNNLNKLRTLDLSKNRIKTISKEMLTPLKSLEKLNLRGNVLESFGTSQLPQLLHLKSINLSKNPLKSLSLTDVEKLAPKLETIDLSDTLITEEELEELRKIPNINFIN